MNKNLKFVLKPAYLFTLIAVGLTALLLINGCDGGGSSSDSTVPSTFTVSGRIRTPTTVIIDSDVNDPSAPYVSNDHFNLPQSLPNPVTVGGYVNVAGSGAPGLSWLSGDEFDFFLLPVASGQTVNLFIAEDPVANLNLFLYDNSQSPVASSENLSGTESITILTDGKYFIEVRAVRGASNYNLTIGQRTGSLDKNVLRVSEKFVPGEIVLRFKDNDQADKASVDAATRAESVGMTAKSGASRRAMLFSFDDESDKHRAFTALGIKAQQLTYQVSDLKIQRKLDTLQIIQALRRRKDILYAEPNYIWRSFLTPDDTLYTKQWHYPLLNLPQTWDVVTGSNFVIVGVIDTGVLLDHPDLDGNLDDVLAPGYDFIRNPARSLDGDGIDPNPDDPGDQSPGGSSFHGTHVAGTIAAETNNATGVAAVTWNTLIMPLRVLGSSGGTVYDVMQAVLYAAGLPNDSGTTPPTNAHIVNLSLGGGGFSQFAQDIFNQARSAGVIIIAAAGNESSGTPSYPAGYDGVVSVGGVDINKNLSWYSNFGSTIDVTAPGGDTGTDINADGFPDGVLSTCGDDTSGSIKFGYCFKQGTSMATPHMAGVVALMKTVYGNLTPDELDTLLASGTITEDLGMPGRDDQFGNGLIDALKAAGEAERLFSGRDLPATLIAEPTSINFGIGRQAIDLILRNAGGSSTTLNVNLPTPSENWLIITPMANIGSDGLGTYSVTIDDSGLSDGVYSASIDITSDANDALVSVTMQVGIVSAQAGDAGFHYVLLRDAETLDTIDQDEVAYDGSGGYSYRFTDVPVGSYKIYAGTDSDNDNGIGDAGEAFGAYQTVDQPITIDLSGNISGLDFTTGFDVTVPAQRATGMLINRPLLKRLNSKKTAR